MNNMFCQNKGLSGTQRHLTDKICVVGIYVSSVLSGEDHLSSTSMVSPYCVDGQFVRAHYTELIALA